MGNHFLRSNLGLILILIFFLVGISVFMWLGYQDRQKNLAQQENFPTIIQVDIENTEFSTSTDFIPLTSTKAQTQESTESIPSPTITTPQEYRETATITPNPFFQITNQVPTAVLGTSAVINRTPTSTMMLLPTSTPTGTENRRLFFLSNRTGIQQLYHMLSDGSAQFSITTSQEDVIDPTISPDGSQIVFVRQSEEEKYDLFQINFDSTSLIRLTNTIEEEASPVWSPDGSKIVFSALREQYFDLYLYDVNLKTTTRLTDDPSLNITPVWSPDSKRIAFSTNRNNSWDIYIINIDGSGLINLTNHPSLDFAPAWSPDGEHLAFHSMRDGSPEIYLQNVTNFAITRLTDTAASNQYPIWSPDGSRLLFISETGLGTVDSPKNKDIFVVQKDGSGIVNLTNHPATDQNPAWSPDGNKIAFSTNRDGNFEIYVMSADGSRLLRLTTDNAVNDHPIWKP